MTSKQTHNRKGGSTSSAHSKGQTSPASSQAFSRIFEEATQSIILQSGELESKQQATFMWGQNSFGELAGQPTGKFFSDPVCDQLLYKGVPLLIEEIACGHSHVLLRSKGKLFAMGSNQHGQLGCGDARPRDSPEHIELSGVRTICCGTQSSYAIKHDGSLFSWGHNDAG